MDEVPLKSSAVNSECTNCKRKPPPDLRTPSDSKSVPRPGSCPPGFCAVHAARPVCPRTAAVQLLRAAPAWASERPRQAPGRGSPASGPGGAPAMGHSSARDAAQAPLPSSAAAAAVGGAAARRPSIAERVSLYMASYCSSATEAVHGSTEGKSTRALRRSARAWAGGQGRFWYASMPASRRRRSKATGLLANSMWTAAPVK
mmetsp:Transcript_1168/g.2519  ORF Transcript_1168/g.2519 Transcript_1168/m.2519 type:complete len:202 (-) Transcript_1168:785-1390(-)